MEYLDAYLDENLSSFEGDQDMQIYTGDGDDFLNFAGAQNFANEVQAARVFVVNIDATELTENKKVAILRGYEDGDNTPKISDAPLIAGKKADGGTAYLRASGSPSTIISFQEFIKNVPSNLVGMRISATKPEQLQQVAQFIEKSPFSSPKSKDLFLGTHITENTYRDNIVTVPTPGIILGPETKMLFDVVAGSKVTITFFVGAVLSTSSALKKKRARAISHIAAVGLDRVRKGGLFPGIAKVLKR